MVKYNEIRIDDYPISVVGFLILILLVSSVGQGEIGGSRMQQYQCWESKGSHVRNLTSNPSREGALTRAVEGERPYSGPP